MDEAYISARDLAKRYRSGDSELVVFSGVSLDVQRGEMLALVGESGAGKSTLLHLLGGLDRPSNGTIYYGGREISGLADSEQADFRNRERESKPHWPPGRHPTGLCPRHWATE